MKKQDFKVLKTKDLYPFPDNPFHVAEDETLSELAESIKEFGIVTPIITRPKEDGNGYEVIAGQRRVRASELAGINTVPAFVLPLDRDRAIITLVDSNLQRPAAGSIVHSSGAASMIGSHAALGYIVMGLLAFLLGVCVTVLLYRLRRRNERRSREEKEDEL